VVCSRRTVHSAVPDRASHDQTHVFLENAFGRPLVPWGMAAGPDGALYVAVDLSYNARAWRPGCHVPQGLTWLSCLKACSIFWHFLRDEPHQGGCSAA
jgi:hypothetical protein